MLANNANIDAAGNDLYQRSGFATQYRQASGTHAWSTAPSGTAGNPITFKQAMTLDESGNLGLGVTPSAWQANNYAVLEIGAVGHALFSTKAVGVGNPNNTLVTQNAYYDGNWRHGYAGTAAHYEIQNGAHKWQSAPAGAAGASITWVEAMRLDINGNLAIAGATATKASGTTWANPSDVRLKDNIQPFAKGLNEILKVDVKTWEYNGKGGTVAGTKGLGVIADEVMQVLPDTVDTYSAKLNPDDAEEIDIKRFDATEITWLLVNSIKEQQALITDLQTRLAALEAKP